MFRFENEIYRYYLIAFYASDTMAYLDNEDRSKMAT